MECHFLFEKPMSIPFYSGWLRGNFTAECFLLVARLVACYSVDFHTLALDFV